MWLRPSLALSAVIALVLVFVAVPVAAVDSDGDGLHDGFERRHGLTSPSDPDSDGDGVVDSAEDHDGDGLGNRGEQKYGTHPGRRDSDGDGRSDGNEDQDRDGRSNAREQDERPLPVALTPGLDTASSDKQPDTERCQTAHRVEAVTTCVFGDPDSTTTMALVGDSHMTMYLTPYKRIAAARGWRLVTMTKAGCPAFLGMDGRRQYEIDRGTTCRRWRRAVLDKLKADPPDYLVFGHTDYRLVTLKGKFVPVSKRPGIWRDSIKRTLKRLPAGTKVLVVGRVPHTRTHPVKCLRRHPQDMSECVTRRTPASARAIDNAIKAGAHQSGAVYATLHGKICSYDPCPVVQGDVLIWRGGGHVTETFANQLRPSLASMVRRKLVNAK